MRILLTTDTIGGVWTFTQELASGLLRHGHEVALLALGREPSESQQAWAAAQSAQHRDHFQALFSPAPLEWMDNNARAQGEGTEALLSLAEVFRPDLLHSNQFCFGALATDYPRLITAHSDVLSWAHACRPHGFAASDWLDTYVSLVDAGLRGADAVTAPTDWMLRALREHYEVLPEKHTVIPNGRTLSSPAPARERKLQAVSVGRLWDEGKNVCLLADVHSPWPLLIAGESELNNAKASAFPENATFLGNLSGKEIFEVFRESSVYICTSIYEPFGLAPLEAALCGCALLLNDLPSLREIWGDAALYFRDARELSALLHRLAHSSGSLAAWQQNSHQRATHFTAERMVEAYIRQYEELLRDADDNTTRELARDAA